VLHEQRQKSFVRRFNIELSQKFFYLIKIAREEGRIRKEIGVPNGWIILTADGNEAVFVDRRSMRTNVDLPFNLPNHSYPITPQRLDSLKSHLKPHKLILGEPSGGGRGDEPSQQLIIPPPPPRDILPHQFVDDRVNVGTGPGE